MLELDPNVAWPIVVVVGGWVISVERRLTSLRSLNRVVNRVDRRTLRLAVALHVQDEADDNDVDESEVGA